MNPNNNDYEDLINNLGKLIELQNQAISQNLPYYEYRFQFL